MYIEIISPAKKIYNMYMYEILCQSGPIFPYSQPTPSPPPLSGSVVVERRITHTHTHTHITQTTNHNTA